MPDHHFPDVTKQQRNHHRPPFSDDYDDDLMLHKNNHPAVHKHQHQQQLLDLFSAAESSTEIDEMSSSEAYYMNDREDDLDDGLGSLSAFLHDEPFPIEDGIERLDLMDTTTTTTTNSEQRQEERDHQQSCSAPAATSTTTTTSSVDASWESYEQVEALMYGMNKMTINHEAAMALAQQYPADPVMVAVQALLHRDEATARRLWARANEIGISSKVEQQHHLQQVSSSSVNSTKGTGLVQALVGKMLEGGLGGVKQNKQNAEFWYNQGAKGCKNAVAQCFLGLFHLKAYEYSKARFWLEQAAASGHARAQMHFGLLFEHADNYNRVVDCETAKYWYQKASAQGDTKAMCRLGVIERKKNNHDSVVEYGQIVKRTTRAAGNKTTTQRSPFPVFESATLFEHHHLPHSNEGDTMEYDDVMAVKSQWLDNPSSDFAASEKRSVENILLGSSAIDGGNGARITKDKEASPFHSPFAVEDADVTSLDEDKVDDNPLPYQKPQDPVSMQEGLKALDLMDIQDDHTIVVDSNNAAYEKIEALLYGMNKLKINKQAALDLTRQYPADPVMVGVQALLHRDDATANQLWKKANELGISSKVEQGCGLVQALVGKMLESGLGGVKENSRQAEFWYNQAAKKGQATAQCFLGLFHLKACDNGKARYWLEQAANQGHARAQMQFGLLFEHVTEQDDRETAKYWYKLAANQGDAKAECRLDFVEGKRRYDATDAGYGSAEDFISNNQQQRYQESSSMSKRGYMETTSHSPGAIMPALSNHQPNAIVGRDSKRQKASEAVDESDTTRFGSLYSPISQAMPSSAPTNFQLGTNTTAPQSQFTAQPALTSTQMRPMLETPAKTTPVAPPTPRQKCSPGLAFDVIRPYCAVMGDKSTRGARLTMGTKVLREVKEWFKDNKTAYLDSGRGEPLLYEEALQRYFSKMAEIFEDFPTDPMAREQTLLVKCTKKSLESDRVARPNCFRYANEKQCQYGAAKLPNAILFYFDSRDPPKLEAEVTKYRRKLGARPDLQGQGRQYFERYLDFCAMTSRQASSDGCTTAQVALESTNFIPALKKLWDDLEKTK